MTKAPYLWLLGLGLASVAAFGWWLTQSREEPVVLQQSTPSIPTKADEVDSVLSDRVLVGGIERPKSDVSILENKPPREPTAPKKKRQGHSPFLATDTNPQVALVAEALKSREHSERFSSYVIPSSFDKSLFDRDPASYATEYSKVVEPGRVFASAQPTDGVIPIVASTNRFHRLRQGESVRLGVKAVRHAPVTFTSFDLGQFDNMLTSTTVIADETGVASANFTASGGTIDKVSILAASPVTSGQVSFTVLVTVPLVSNGKN